MVMVIKNDLLLFREVEKYASRWNSQAARRPCLEQSERRSCKKLDEAGIRV
jgi:hypothetical protein